jgi:hypothetical protein
MREDSAAAFATWLESYPFKWTKSGRLVEPLEEDFWTSVAAGVVEPVPVDVGAPTLADAFSGSTDAERRDIGSHHRSLAEVVEAARHDSRAERREEIAELAGNVRRDFAEFQATGKTEAERLARVDLKKRDALRAKARDSAARLKMDAMFVGTRATPGSVQDALVDLVSTNPRALPLWRVRQAMTESLREVVLRTTPGSKRDARLLGDVLDAEHAGVGAAYCDVFTCDVENEPTIAPVRTALGLDAPIALRHGAPRSEFLERLVTALEAVGA